ncbi:MAG: chemotaxis protein CheX [Anaerolineaceae bacterium]|nr:MAG: chemotaxis protein CheX [Anaerolineaceae bacterium]
MFGLYFGDYLLEKNKITGSQLEDVITQQHTIRAKLGLIAVAEKLLTSKQANELNELQKLKDSRFGDLAIEKGYLLKEEVNYLLNLQGNSYLKYVQALTEKNIMTMDQIESALEEFKSENGFSDTELDALKSGDIDRIIPVFVDINIPLVGEYITLVIRNIIRFINNNIKLKKIYTVKEYTFPSIAYQQLVGNHNLLVCFAGEDEALLTIASPFAKEDFERMDEDAFDSICEFINCSNGLYASKLSTEDIHIDMTPPKFDQEKTLSSNGDIYVVPIVIDGKQSDLLVVVDHKVEIN